MTKNLMINPELYDLTFIADDSFKLELIRDNFTNIPNSKTKIIQYNDSHALAVYKDLYQDVIDQGLYFLKMDEHLDNVSWITKNNNTVPCGFYHVASAKLKDDDFTSYQDAFSYLEKIKVDTNCELYYSFDRLLKKYNICLKGFGYDELVEKFKYFILKNGNGPFDSFQFVSRYGKYIQEDNRVLCKEK